MCFSFKWIKGIVIVFQATRFLAGRTIIFDIHRYAIAHKSKMLSWVDRRTKSDSFLP